MPCLPVRIDGQGNKMNMLFTAVRKALTEFLSIKHGQLIFNRSAEIEAGLPAMCRVRPVGRSARLAIFVLYQNFQNSIRCLLPSKSRIRDAQVVYSTCKE